jgi:hypothetical protein
MHSKSVVLTETLAEISTHEFVINETVWWNLHTILLRDKNIIRQRLRLP